MMKSVIKHIAAFVIGIGVVIVVFMLAVCLSVLISAGTLWAIDTLCGTDFYNWQNIGILSIVLLVVNKIRCGKTARRELE